MKRLIHAIDDGNHKMTITVATEDELLLMKTKKFLQEIYPSAIILVCNEDNLPIKHYDPSYK